MLTNTTTQYLIDGWNDGVTLPFTGEIWEWANKYVILKSPFEPTGPFDISFSPYMRQPMMALRDKTISQINILKGVQTGGSLVMQLYLLWLVCNEPGPTMLLHQPGDMSKTIMDNKIIPLIKSCQPVNDLIPNKRNSVKKELIEFPHMNVVVSAAKETMLQSLTMRHLLLDEVWLWRNGDIGQAKARTRAMSHNRKIILCSQAGDSDSEWEDEYKSAEKIYDWGWKCPKCSTLQPHKFSLKRSDGSYAGMRWDENEYTKPNDQWIYSKAGETARLECVNVDCKHKVYDTEENRTMLNLNGEYVETINPKGKKGIQSYHWPCWSMRNQKFGEVVERYLEAKQSAKFKDRVKIEDFWKKDLAEFYTPERDMDNIKIVSEDYDSKEKYGDFTFLTVDCQQDLVQLFWVVRSWCANGDSRQIARGVATSFTEITEIQRKYGILHNRVGVDSGYRATTIYKECIKNCGQYNSKGKKVNLYWNAFKGFDKREFLHTDGVKRLYGALAQGDPIDAAYKGKFAPLYLWSNDSYKDMLHTLMKGNLAKWVVNNNDEEFERMMNSEVPLPFIDKRTNRETIKWQQKPGVPNHYWDCELMSLVMATMCGVYGDVTQKVDNKE